jgi:hypothetical protein
VSIWKPDSVLPARAQRIIAGWAILVLLGSVYLITYRGIFRSVDELAMFSLAESLVQTHSLHTPQLEFARYHNYVGRLEPLQSLLATPLYWLAVHSDRLGNIQFVMLFNVLITAVTASVLYALLLDLDHPPRRAALAALIYGLATIAWPYSRGFFREPLLSLLLTTAAYSLFRWQRTRSIRWGVLSVLCLLLSLVTKVTSSMAWLAFALAFALEPGLSKRRRLGRLLGLVVIGTAGSILLDAAYRMRLGRSVLDDLTGLPVWNEPSLLLTRFFGLTLGSGRGLFVFSPILVLALPGLVFLWHRRRVAAILCLSVLVVFLLGYSTYDMWHGGLSWGSRFLVPIVPLLLVPVAEWLSRAKGMWRGVTILLAVLSLVIQVPASTADYSVQVGTKDWGEMTNYAHSPAMDQIALWRLTDLDMLWWHSLNAKPSGQTYLNWRIAALPWVTLLAAVGVLLVSTQDHTVPGRRRSGLPSGVVWLAAAVLAVLLAAGMLILSVQAPSAMIGYSGVDLAELRQVAAIVNEDRDMPHVVVSVSNEFQYNLLLNMLKGQFVHYWFSPVQDEVFDVLLTPPLHAQRLRLIVDRAHMQPDHPEHNAEFWLNAQLHRYFAEWVSDAYQMYSYLYPPDALPMETVDYYWASGMRLIAYGMVPTALAPGEPIWLKFHFSATRQPEANYDVFVQLLAPDGRFVNGTDGAPQFGAAPTGNWVPDRVIVDRRACFVPPDAAQGRYRVIAGFYWDGERQAVLDSAGQEIGTHVELGYVNIEQP